MPPLNPYLTFNGNCAEAMQFYQKTLGGKLDIIKMSAAPAAQQIPPGNENRTMHARLVFDGGTIMASDALTTQTYEGMSGISLSLIYSTAAEAKKVFESLAKGGKVTMPLDKTFWSEAFGMVTDRFGTPWMINGAMTPAM